MGKHNIPLSDALATLSDFLRDENQSRAGNPRVIGNTITIKYNEKRSRSANDSVDCDNLVYIVNFENNAGYAVLAADNRIPEPILVLTDSGNYEVRPEYPMFTKSDLDTMSISPITGYPMYCPGFFTLAEFGDELFMNPNTVNLYSEEKDDFLVGNFAGIGIASLKDIDDEELVSRNLMDDLVMDYVVNNVENHNNDKPEVITPVEGYGHSQYYYDRQEQWVITVSDWTILEKVDPLISRYIYWHQKAPYNKYCPKPWSIINKSRENAYVGCVPLSIGKIMSYHRYPIHQSDDSATIVNWDAVSANMFGVGNSDETAKLLRSIGVGCLSMYFSDGTFTFPSLAAFYLWRKGYANVHYGSYDYSRTIASLKKSCLVFICSIPQKKFPWQALAASHAWLIDGYKTKKRRQIFKLVKSGNVVETKECEETLKMLHCDFGWKEGKANGYFAEGIFDFKSQYYEPDGIRTDIDYNYKNYLKTITSVDDKN